MNLFRVLVSFLFVLAFSWTVQAQTATVTWGNTHQTIDGFGAYSDEQSIFTSAQADQLFSITANPGAGLSLLRTQVPNGDSTQPGDCTSVGTGCSRTVTNLQMAVARGARVWAASWSPPASMKSNGSVICNNNNTGASSLNASSYQAFANWQSNYIGSLSLLGISLYAISPQNEPDYCPTYYEGASMSAAQFDTYVKDNLGPTMAAAGQTSTLILMPETSDCANLAGHADTAFTDSAAMAYLGIAACHDYDYDASTGGKQINLSQSAYSDASNHGKKYWETEVFGQVAGNSGSYDPSITDALAWAQQIHNWMTVANANAWHWWTVFAGGSDNESLYGTDRTTPAKRLWAIGNFSRFVRPGFVRIDATSAPQSGVLVSAYKQISSGNFAIVVINRNASSVSQEFSLAGFTSSSVTPWITSASLNLSQQSSVSVSESSFTFTLPADSITTFVGVAGNGATNTTPNPPSNLKAVVQ
jgi:glucuronoarabinoxylan endo-1,4-beta-xylanase